MLTLARLVVAHVLGGRQSIDAAPPPRRRALIGTGASNFTDLANDNIFPVRSSAVGLICLKLDAEICRKCECQIFRECKTSLPSGELRAPAVPAAAASS